ncbi:MAG: tetratricopeptide repeat protein [Longimicrobiales bacterium]
MISPFGRDTLRFADATVYPERRARDFVFRIEYEDGGSDRILVDAVVGGGHLVGGGTQGYLTRAVDGTLRFLPFDWSATSGVWFCNTNTRLGRGWVPIGPQLRLSDCGDWPPTRVLGTEPRFGSCQQCHGSQITLRFDTTAHQYGTRFTSLAVNCESCHGPGREHVELARTGRLATAVDPGIGQLELLSEDASLEVCFQCHALKDELSGQPYLPGESFSEHYSIAFPLLGDAALHADGRVRTFAYQANHLYSDCYLSGRLTCTDCHDPHGQGYRDQTGRPLDSRFSNGQCLGCHPSKQPVEKHTQHPAESAGSRCVSCHMPYLQEQEIGRLIRYARSDHTIAIPRPGWDSELGIVSGCAQCHEDRDGALLEQDVERWWGPLKPQNPVVLALSQAHGITDLESAAEVLLTTGEMHPLGRFAALAELYERFLKPDMEELPQATEERLRAVAWSGNVDHAALALAALHLARGEDAATREFLAERLRRTPPSVEPALRLRWALALGFKGDAYRAEGLTRAAITSYRRSLEILPEHPGTYHNLALALVEARNYEDAIAAYVRSLQLDPTRSLAYVNLGVALNAAGRMGEAAQAYRRAIDMNPYDPLAHMNLGNFYLRANRPAEAAPLYARAVALDPANVQAQLYLARTLIMLGRLTEARDAVANALRFEPNNPAAQTLRIDLERVLGVR